MSDQSCKRCRAAEYIPTHQFLKFDNEVQYVCKSCWEDFRRWYFRGDSKEKSRPVYAA